MPTMTTPLEKPIRGAIKKLCDGYFWITGDDGVDRFAHRSSMQATSPTRFEDLERHQRVEFLHVDAVKGPRAIEVRTL